jgi:hypothetical protein
MTEGLLSLPVILRTTYHSTVVHGQGEWPQFSHLTVLYRSYLKRCFKYDARCLKVNVGGDGFRWQRMLNAGVRAGFLQEVVTHMPLRPGEAERSIFQPDQPEKGKPPTIQSRVKTSVIFLQ